MITITIEETENGFHVQTQGVHISASSRATGPQISQSRIFTTSAELIQYVIDAVGAYDIICNHCEKPLSLKGV